MNKQEQGIRDTTLNTYGIECNVLQFVDGLTTGLTFGLMSKVSAYKLNDIFSKKFKTQLDHNREGNGKWYLHIFNTDNPYQ